MSTAGRRIRDIDDAAEPAVELHPPLRRLLRDEVVRNQMDWAPFDSPWRAPPALLDLIGSSTVPRPDDGHNDRNGSSQK